MHSNSNYDYISNIFEIDEQKVLSIELENFEKDIATYCHMNLNLPLQINYILYKINQLNDHLKIRNLLINRVCENDPSENPILFNNDKLKIWEFFKNDNEFFNIKKILIDKLIFCLFKLQGLNIDSIKYDLIDSKYGQINYSYLELYKMIENKYINTSTINKS